MSFLAANLKDGMLVLWGLNMSVLGPTGGETWSDCLEFFPLEQKCEGKLFFSSVKACLQCCDVVIVLQTGGGGRAGLGSKWEG